jgi:L-histidine N-alpha-methyltransferase
MSRLYTPASGPGLLQRGDASATTQFAADVQYYLTQTPRQLPSRYLYDALGSSLFEAICRLPWYGITRAEERLLTQHAGDVLRRLSPLSTIVELGSGSGQKLRILIGDRQRDAPALDVHLVDVSPSALDASARAIESLEGVHITPHQASYEDGLRDAAEHVRTGDRALVLFLGSNIGNYDPPGASAFLDDVRRQLRSGDAFLVGADLVKPARALQTAYDDPLGVTAAFNRNLLVRINRELGGDFDLDQFAHEAVFNTAESRVEMHLVARRAQEIHVEAASIAFTMRESERIWTESSYKYRPDDIVGQLEAAGFRLLSQWLDAGDQFALTLVEAV